MTGWWFQPLWTICPSCGSASLYDGWTSKKTTKKHQSDHHRFYLLNIIRKNRFKLYIPITNGHFLSKPLWFTTNTPPIRPAALADSFSISSVPPQDGDQLPGCDDGERRWWRATICFFVQLSYIKRVAWCRSYYIMTHLWEDTWRYPTYEWLNDLHTEHWKQSTNVYHDYWRQSHETGVDTHKIGLTVCSLAEVALPKSSCGIIGCGISDEPWKWTWGGPDGLDFFDLSWGPSKNRVVWKYNVHVKLIIICTNETAIWRVIHHFHPFPDPSLKTTQPRLRANVGSGVPNRYRTR